MLANNTAALIAKFEAERQALFAQARERQRKELEARQQREIEREPAQLA